MPNDKAIEAAARAALETVMADGDHLGDWLDFMTDDNLAVAKDFTTSAIRSFLRNCGTATSAMVDVVEAQFQHWKNDTGTNGPIIRANAFWQALLEAKSAELEGK